MDSFNLTNNFLIAMPTLEDPYFSKALIYVCEHTEHGALGLVINRPTDLTIGDLLQRIDLPLPRREAKAACCHIK